jgi:hypothetical protein
MQACSFRYGHEAPKHLLVFTLGTVYSVINPVILPLAALYFALGFVVLKYKMLYVYLPLYEGEGFIWPLLVRCMLLSLVILHLTLIGFFGLKKATYELFFVLPLPVATFYMDCYWNKTFQRPAKFPPMCLLGASAAHGGDCREPAGGCASEGREEDPGMSEYGGRDLYLSPMLSMPYVFLDPQDARDDEEEGDGVSFSPSS